MSGNNKNGKQSLYFPATMLAEMYSEATRLDRPVSYVVQRAWKIAKKAIRELRDNPHVQDEYDR